MNKKILLATSLGNILEWFDFGLFIYLAPVLGKKFFPIGNENQAIFAVFSVFAAGYICRPFGGILFGYLGDTYGRAKTLRYSIIMISLATCLLGMLPSYSLLGITATVLFIFFRMIQGISVGGEYCGIMIYLAESAPINRRGFITSFAGSGANLGFLLATISVIIIKMFMPHDVLEQWGWRVPFILVGTIGLVILYYRLKFSETETYLHLKMQHLIQAKPLLMAFKYASKNLVVVLGITCLSSSFYIIFFGYMPRYLSQYTATSLNLALIIQTSLLFLMLFLIPIAGMIGDQVGRKKILLWTYVSIFIWLIPGFYLLQSPTITLVIGSLLIATLLSSTDQGNNLSAFVENMPSEVRYSGVAFAYNVGNAVFGGTAPLIVSFLTHKFGLIAPAYYLMATAIISFTAALAMLNNSETFR